VGRGSAAPAEAAAAVTERPAGGLLMSSSAEAKVGGTMAVTLANRSGQRSSGELQYDATLLQPASAPPPGASPGRWPFTLEPQAETVLILRVLPAAAGQNVVVQASADTTVEGAVQLLVPAAAEPAR
jgi:general secretion pathway protein D